MCPLSREINFLSEGVRLGLDKEIAPDGTYLAYFPFGARIERSRMTPYREKYFLSEGVRFGSDTKAGGWDILSVFPIRQFD